MNEKLKVVWVCHFSNEFIREKLPFGNQKLYLILRKIFGKKSNNLRDFAPWITLQIKEFEKFDDVELHIISPHFGMRYSTYEFKSNGIYYHFFRPGLPFQIDDFFSKLLNYKNRKYWLNRFWIGNYIKMVDPDIINLIGTESPYYSISALDFPDIPVFVSIQTVYSNPQRKKISGKLNQLNWDIEQQIFRRLFYYGCSGRLYRDLILNSNEHAKIFKFFFPIKTPEMSVDTLKSFDFVCYAAKIEKKKGIEDAIIALSKVKSTKPDVTLNIVGSCSKEYKNILVGKIKELGLMDNIIFNDYFSKHSDMLRHIQKSKYAILPIKLDVIPGTVIEAMQLNLPVITYKTTGTPYLNKNGESILLADIGDTDILAMHMLNLLITPELGTNLKMNAKKIIEKEFENEVLSKRLVDIYRAVISHYNQNTAIPIKLLFNTEEFPVY